MYPLLGFLHFPPCFFGDDDVDDWDVGTSCGTGFGSVDSGALMPACSEGDGGGGVIMIFCGV